MSSTFLPVYNGYRGLHESSIVVGRRMFTTLAYVDNQALEAKAEKEITHEIRKK